MKLKAALIILSLLVAFYSYSQNDICNRNLSPTTDPDKISGSWDWRTQKWDMRYPGIDCSDPNVTVTPVYCGRISPFYDRESQNVYYLANFDITNQLLRDYHPSNGWELIFRKLGNPFTSEFSKENPSVVLYNKYTGMLRVFVYITSGKGSFNGASITLTFLKGYKMTALLSKVNSKINALDQFDKMNEANELISMAVPNYFSNTEGYWLEADFQTMYDPCTCGIQSSLIINPWLINTTDVEIAIRGTISPEGMSKDGAITSGGNSQASNSLSKVKDGVHNVSKAFKSTESAVNTISNWVETQNPKATTKKFETFKAYKQWHEDTYGLVEFDDVNINWNEGTVEGTFKKLNVATKGIQLLGKALNFGKYIPVIGQGLGFLSDAITMFSGGSSEGTPKPVVQMVDLKASGTLSYKATPTEIMFNTPGSDNANQNQNSNPTYNNILGVFNLMETPRLKYKHYDFDYDRIRSNSYGIDPAQTSKNITVFELEEDIKYVLNPASNLEIEEIKAALVFKSNIDPIDYGSEYRLGKSVYNANQYLRNKGPAMPINYSASIEDQLGKYGYSIETWPSDNSIPYNTDIVYRTNYVPLSTLKNMSIAMYTNGEPSDVEVLVKFYVKYRTKTFAQDNKNVQGIYTFKTKLGTQFPRGKFGNFCPATVQGGRGGIPILRYSCPVAKDTLQMKAYGYYFNDSDIFSNGFENDVTTTNDNLYLNKTLNTGEYKAIYNLRIFDANYTSSLTSTFRAGTQIVFSDETTISGEAVFEIGDVYGSSRFVSPQNNIDIKRFCDDISRYNPNIPPNARNAYDAVASTSNTSMSKTVSTLSAYPNPTFSKTTISYRVPNVSPLKLYITNGFGQIVEEIVNKENHEAGAFEVDYSSQNLAAGMYLLVQEADGRKETIKLAIVK